jgi:hypothetical protein
MFVPMNTPEIIYTFLSQRAPYRVCDDCIGMETGIIPRSQIAPITSALGLTTDFDQTRAACSICDAVKLVTRSLRYA